MKHILSVLILTASAVLWSTQVALAHKTTVFAHAHGKEIHGDIRSVLPILEFIMSIIEEFIEETTEGMIIIDGLEYLLTNNKFNSVLRFLRQLVDNVSQTECILLVAISPDALDQTELTLLEKDLLPLNYVE